MLKNKPLLFVCTLYGIIGAIFVLNLASIGIRVNVSDSLPFYLFASGPLNHEKIEKGTFVSIQHPLNEIKLVKQIAGIPGDQILVQDHCVFINGMNFGHIFEKSRSGQELNPIQEGIIPAGYYFMHAGHPQSFDSRYQEFGLVNEGQMQEILWPVF